MGVINLTAIAVRQLIKMAKKINISKNMSQEDEVMLLKRRCITQMMMLKSAMNFHPTKWSYWTITLIIKKIKY